MKTTRTLAILTRQWKPDTTSEFEVCAQIRACQHLFWRRFENIRVDRGGLITVVARADREETVRLDFVEFIPASSR